jgi:hypothetical protein
MDSEERMTLTRRRHTVGAIKLRRLCAPTPLNQGNMMKQKIITLFIFLSFLFLHSVSAYSQDNTLDKTIKSYLADQFGGMQDMFGRVTFSDKYLAKLQKENYSDYTEERASYHDYTNETCIIVTAYDVEKIRQSGKKASVIVNYHEIAERIKDNNSSRLALRKFNNKSKVTYNFVLNNGEWLVLDPPKPRISVQAITHLFEDGMKTFNNPNWQSNKGLDHGQIKSKRDSYNNFKASFDEIKSLK